MTNEEQKRRIYYLQFGDRLHNEDKMIKLRKTPTYGWAYYGLYMALLAAAVKNNGIIRLAGEDEDYETPAHEIAILIGAERDEVLLVAGMLQRAQKLGMIEITSDDGHKAVLQFELIARYTGSTSQGTVYKNELADKKKSETPAIEDKGAEEPEKKPSNKAKAQKAADEMFERLWRQYFKGYKEDKGRVKPATRYRLYKDYGEERCQKALDEYKVSEKVKDGFILQAKNFFNVRIFDYLDGDAGQDQGFSQYMAPPEIITEKTVQDVIKEQGLFVYGSGYDLALWAQVKGKYSAEMQAAIEKVIKQ